MAETKAAGFVVYRLLDKTYLVDRVEYLLLQTSYGIHHWTPPKGHLESGETNIDAAFRELQEEAGISRDAITISDFKRSLKYEVNGKPKQVVYWLANLKNNEFPIKLSNEHQDFRWSTIDEACHLVQFENMQKLLKECEDFLTSKE